MARFKGSPYLKGLHKLRNVQWGAQYLWDIRFPNAPAPFADWFPAVDIDIDMFELNWKEFELGMTNTSVPIGTGTLALKITFNDDVTSAIQNWITHWVRSEILNNGVGLSPLEQCVKAVQIAKLDFQRRIISSQTFWVVPNGTMSWQGSSSANVNQNTCDFKIVGVASSSHGYDSSPGIFKQYKIGSSGIFGNIISAAQDLLNTYKEVRETYEDVKTTVQAAKQDFEGVIDGFKNAKSAEDYLGAVERGVNTWNNTMDNFDYSTSGVTETAINMERKLKNIF